MSQFLLQHQGLLEDSGILLVFFAVAFLILFAEPKFSKGWREDPMHGTFFAKDHRHRPN